MLTPAQAPSGVPTADASCGPLALVDAECPSGCVAEPAGMAIPGVCAMPYIAGAAVEDGAAMAAPGLSWWTSTVSAANSMTTARRARPVHRLIRTVIASPSPFPSGPLYPEGVLGAR